MHACACVGAWVRGCVRACMRSCVRASLALVSRSTTSYPAHIAIHISIYISVHMSIHVCIHNVYRRVYAYSSACLCACLSAYRCACLCTSIHMPAHHQLVQDSAPACNRHAAFARVRVGVHECVLVPHLDVHAARILVFCSSVLGDVAGQYVLGVRPKAHGSRIYPSRLAQYDDDG